MPAAVASTGSTEHPLRYTAGARRSREASAAPSARRDGAREENPGSARRGPGWPRPRNEGDGETLTHLFHLDLFVVDFFEVEDRRGFNHFSGGGSGHASSFTAGRRGSRGYARVRHQAAKGRDRGYAGLGGGSRRRSGRAWPRRRRGRIRGGLGPHWRRAQAPAPPLRIPRPPAAPRGAAPTPLGRGLCAARHRLGRASPAREAGAPGAAAGLLRQPQRRQGDRGPRRGWGSRSEPRRGRRR